MEIKDKIYTIRGKQVMLDRDLAELYEVEIKRLNEQVKRNSERFPSDFMFKLTYEEYSSLRSHFATFEKGKGKHRKFLPYVFTEQGTASLSGVLKSDKAAQVHVSIMRAFVAMRSFLNQNFDKFLQIDKKLLEHDKNFEKVFDAMEKNKLEPNQGIFFDGQVYDSYDFIVGLVKKASLSIILIDNYIDSSVITLFSEKKDKVKVKIYTSNISPKLELAVKKFNEQYSGLELKEFSKSHDRFLIIDSKIYHFGASLKDLGKKWFAFSHLHDLDILSKLQT